MTQRNSAPDRDSEALLGQKVVAGEGLRQAVDDEGLGQASVGLGDEIDVALEPDFARPGIVRAQDVAGLWPRPASPRPGRRKILTWPDYISRNPGPIHRRTFCLFVRIGL